MTAPARERSRLRVYAWPAIALAFWFIGVGAAYVLGRASGREIPTCMFKRMTGWPCATCGGTRTAGLLAEGDLLGAFAMNPLVALFLIVFPLLAGVWIWRFSRGVARQPRMSKRQSAFYLVLFLVALALNWWYVAAMGR